MQWRGTRAYFRVRRFWGRRQVGSYTHSFAVPRQCTQARCWLLVLQCSPHCKFIPSAGRRLGSQLHGTRCWLGSDMSGGRRLCWARFRWTCLQFLLGGAVALLPVYAREILHTGPWGLGLLRSAPGVGAAVMAIVVAHQPIRRRAGVTMLLCVAGFGVFTIAFGISHSLVLSLVALFLCGASDMISVIIRATLTQLATPDEM